MNELTRTFDQVPGWVWAVSLAVGVPLAFFTPVAIFGWRVLFGTKVRIQLVHVPVVPRGFETDGEKQQCS